MRGSYTVSLYRGAGENRCTTVESAEVRVYRGGSLVQAVPLEPSDVSVLEAELRSEEQPDRLEIVVRYAGQEQIIPVEL